MATIKAQAAALLRIDRFLGVNESPDGDAGLKAGEAAVMRNFRITKEGNLQLRPGWRTVLRLAEDVPVRGLWLGRVESPELLANGSFDGSLAGWAAGTGWSWSSGALHAAGNAAVLTQTAALEAGGEYRLEIQIERTAGTLTASLSGTLETMTLSATGRRTGRFTAGSAAGTVTLAPSADFAGRVGPVSLRRVYEGETPTSRERLMAACGGILWSIDPENWEAENAGTLPDAEAHFFGFSGRLYLLCGGKYLVWNGLTLREVEGYAPTVANTCSPATGIGTALQQVNRLNGRRRKLYSADGSAAVYALGESWIDSVDRVAVNGAVKTAGTDYTVNLTAGTVTFVSAPAAGTDNVDLRWTRGTGERESMGRLRFSEFFNGYTDNRVFLYGDGSNTVYYSGLTLEGEATAEYFPDLNVLSVDSANTPVTALIRQYNRLLVFKPDGCWSVYYDAQTLEDGTVTAGFFLRAINREVGHRLFGQMRLVDNCPYSIHGSAVYRWKQYYSSATRDERNAEPVSCRVRETLLDMDLSGAVTFDDEREREYWLVSGGRAVLHNYGGDAWYVYDHLPARCFVRAGDTLCFGTGDGRLCRLSRDCRGDDGEPIDAWWESGALSFGSECLTKYGGDAWIVLKPESGARLTLTVQTDRSSSLPDRTAASGLASYRNADYAHWAYGTNRKPKSVRLRLRTGPFAHCKLIFSSRSASAAATVLSCAVEAVRTGRAGR